MITLIKVEQKAVDEYKLAAAAEEAAGDKLEAIFRVRIEALCAKGDFNSASEYLKEMPESVGKLFLADYIRNARGDFLTNNRNNFK